MAGTAGTFPNTWAGAVAQMAVPVPGQAVPRCTRGACLVDDMSLCKWRFSMLMSCSCVNGCACVLESCAKMRQRCVLLFGDAFLQHRRFPVLLSCSPS
eukprot:scaffold183597_cov22-Tisochrysis_lutea.AAC.1